MSTPATWEFTGRYSTADELGFVRYLAVNNQPGFQRYANIVIGGMRTFDPSVNVVRVVEEIERMRGVRL